MEKYRSEYLYEYAKNTIPDEQVWRVFVPSYSRPDAKLLKVIEREPEFPLVLCIRREQEHLYSHWNCDKLLLDNVHDIAETRQAIIEAASDWCDDIFMFDDKVSELDFLIPSFTKSGVESMRSSRIVNNGTAPRWTDVLKMWMLYVKSCSEKVFISSPSYRPDSWSMKFKDAKPNYNSGACGRCMHINLKLCNKWGMSFLPLNVAGVEDVGFQLQGLTAGLYNLICTDFVYNCSCADGEPGGCSAASNLPLKERWEQYTQTAKKFWGENHPGIHWDKITRQGVPSIKLKWKYWKTLVEEKDK